MKIITCVAAAATIAIPASSAAQENPFAATQAENPFLQAQSDRYIGTFLSDAISLTVEGSNGSMTGTLYYTATELSYPFVAEVIDGVLTGTFNASGRNFPFTFALNSAGSNGQFETEGFSGQLRRADSQIDAQSLLPRSEVEKLIDEALDVANTVAIEQRYLAISTIVSYKAALGDIDGARALANTIPASDFSKDSAIIGIAQGQLKQGDVEGAQATANSVSAGTMRNIFNTSLIGHYIEQGETNTALSLARSTPIGDRPSALSAAATALKAAGDEQTALALLSEAGSIAKSLNDQIEHDTALFSIALAYGQQNNVPEARKLASEIESDLTRSMAFGLVGQALVTAGNPDGARDMADVAMKEARRLKPKALRPSGYLQVASIYAALGDDTNVIEMITPYVTDGGGMEIFNRSIAMVRVNFKHYALVRAYLGTTSDPQVEGMLGSAIAIDQLNAGDIEGALSSARSIADPYQRSAMIGAIAMNIANSE